MRPLERVDQLLTAVKAAVAGAQPGVWTALPGIVQSFDAAKGTCSVQPAIQVQVSDKDGKKTFINLPVCVDVPVQFMGTNDFVMTWPIKKDVEGIVIFSCRCIDAWWQSGGVQPQAELRLHDLSDGMFIPGLRSQAHKITNINANFPEWRSADGSVKMTQTATGWMVTGDLKVTGAMIAGFGTADQINVQTHTHPGNNLPPAPGS